MSPANREMSNSLLDSINEHFVNTIAQARNLDAETVHRVIDSAPISAEQFIDAKLADGSKYLEDLQEELGGKETPLVALDDYSRVDPESMKLNRGPKIAVVFAVGGIVTGRSHSSAQGQMLGARTVSEALQEAADDDDIKAIIFRIDSPGGSALASDLVWRATQSAKKRKPVIVSMSDVAGSGGYYIAAGASRILAQPTTFTGSIGVVFARPYIHGLLQKIGVNTETITRGRFATVDDLTTPLDAEEREKLLQEIHHIYDVFVQRVAEGRKLSAEQVNEIGRGRVWTGTQANRNGLVDEIGGFRAAVQAAKQAAALPLDGEVKLVFFPRHKSLLERVSETLENGEAAALPPVFRDLLKLSPPLDLRGALTLMPQRIEIQ
jgi:protease-4